MTQFLSCLDQRCLCMIGKGGGIWRGKKHAVWSGRTTPTVPSSCLASTWRRLRSTVCNFRGDFARKVDFDGEVPSGREISTARSPIGQNPPLSSSPHQTNSRSESQQSMPGRAGKPVSLCLGPRGPAVGSLISPVVGAAISKLHAQLGRWFVPALGPCQGVSTAEMRHQEPRSARCLDWAAPPERTWGSIKPDPPVGPAAAPKLCPGEIMEQHLGGPQGISVKAGHRAFFSLHTPSSASSPSFWVYAERSLFSPSSTRVERSSRLISSTLWPL